MAATPLPVYELPSGYSIAPETIAFTSADPTNGNSFTATGEEIVLIQNDATAVNEVQQVVDASASAGTFTLAFTFGGNTYTTAAIAYNAAASAVAAAVLAATTGSGHTLAQDFPFGSVVGSGGALPTAVLLTFGGTFGGQPLTLMTANSGGLTGGTTVITKSTVGYGLLPFTISSQPDNPAGRLGNETGSLFAGQLGVSQLFPTSGWASGGIINLSAADAHILFAVLRVPV